LAAEMVDFSGEYVESRHVNQLQWTTLSEFNNDYFEIQRSIGKDDFEAIGKVPGINKPNLYSYTDNDIASSGVHIYRLRQVDFDGTETFSDQIAIKVSDDASAKTHVSPNPATNIVNLHIEGKTDDQIKVQVFNMSGQKVLSDVNEIMNDNTQIFELNTSTFQKGIYNVMVQVNNEIFHHKLLIVD
ncbi:MAG: T9SS type A sorting domain-containing protein, partial [Saprospiraceae bacterium]